MNSIRIISLVLSIIGFSQLVNAQDWWGQNAEIGTAGVMEIGSHIDFHDSDNDTKDYSNRIWSAGGWLYYTGGLRGVGRLLLDDPNETSDWNTLWQSGFFQSYNAINGPESSGWFWGINMGHGTNNANYRYGGQIAIKNHSTSPTMYFRSTGKDGIGIWTKVLHNNGNQQINGDLTINNGNSGAAPHSFSDLTIHDDDHGMITIATPNTNSAYYGFADPEDNYVAGIYYNHANDEMKLTVNNLNPVMINKLGFVGIGTTSPTTVMHVVQDAVGDAENDATSVVKWEIGRQKLTLKAVRTANQANWNNTTLKLQAGVDATSHQSIDFVNDENFLEHIDIYTGNQLFNTRFTANGNVGIGTTTPDEKLAVAGTIHAQEVRVDMIGWPDYVFTPSYNLLTLEEVKRHIEEKGHLPNIPSAAEVEENGLNLGEMNAKLLEKIEELTLYVIELQERNKEQDKIINQLLENK